MRRTYIHIDSGDMSMQNIWRKKRKTNYVFGGLEKLNFTYITYKFAKSNLGNLCL